MNKVSYMGNGEIVEFDFTFPFYENNNVVVLKNNKPATGYVIVGVSAGENADVPYMGGRVVFDFAPLPTDSIVISRKLPLSRVVDYQPLAKIEPKLLNLDMNYLMESLKDFQDELDTFNECYNGIVNVESVDVLLKKIKFIEQLIQSKSVITRDYLNSFITNCITEIPQDIKLEIVDGAVVLKAGSKGYRPNGAGVFNQITASTDISRTTSTDGVYMVVSWGLTSLELVNINSCFSGATQPVNPPKNSVWYDTTNNVIKETYDGGATWGGTLLFPLGIVTVSNGKVSSIDQVFNGFGYIGSCVFTLPRVKGLYPNGRNEDGTLKNGLINCTDVQVSSNFNDTNEHTLMINPNGRCAWYSTTGWYYNDIANVMVASTGTVLTSATLGTFKTTNGVVSNLNPYEVFHAVDYSDTGFIAHQSMPSDKYIDLNLGQSGAVYTASADGFVCLRAKTTVAGKAYCITNEVNGMQNMVTVDGLGSEFGICLPVSDGQVFSVEYGGALDSGYVFRFVFLNAAK